MIYLKIFFLSFTCLFFIGFSVGWTDCSKYKLDDYLIRNVRIAINNDDSSRAAFYLCYVKNQDTLINYSVDSNRFIKKAEWVILRNLGFCQSISIPFITNFGSVRCFFFRCRSCSNRFPTFA